MATRVIFMGQKPCVAGLAWLPVLKFLAILPKEKIYLFKKCLIKF